MLELKDVIIIQDKILQNIKIFWAWNYTAMCELNTEKCLCTIEMKIIEYNRRNKWTLNKGSINIFYFSLLTYLTENTFSIRNISFEFKQYCVSFYVNLKYDANDLKL